VLPVYVLGRLFLAESRRCRCHKLRHKVFAASSSLDG